LTATICLDNLGVFPNWTNRGAETHVADPPHSPETEDDAGGGPDRGAANSTPRWVFVLGIIIATALLGLMVFLHLSGTLGPGVH